MTLGTYGHLFEYCCKRASAHGEPHHSGRAIATGILFALVSLAILSGMVVEWDRPLGHRQGSPNRLARIDLYFDCDWFALFPNGRAQFRNGKSLAALVRRVCPVGKTPALLLTTRTDVEDQTIETDEEYVVVLNLPRYLAEASADAAASYYARALGSAITRTGQLQLFEMAARPEVINAVVDHQLELEHISAWVSGRTDRILQLRSIAGVSDRSADTAEPHTVMSALEALETIDPEIAAAIERVFDRALDKEIRLRFLRALTADSEGRQATSGVLGERINDRLDDARETRDTYSALLADPQSTETHLQNFIEDHPWLLGLDYARVRPRRGLPRGEMDFILERHDGYHDLLELKDPWDRIVNAPDAVDGVIPPASSFALSSALAQALAQVHVYRETLSGDPVMVERLYGLRNTRDPRVIIVIGQAGPLPHHRLSVLRDLNLSLHRVEIVPYDVLADRATTILNNVERHLMNASGEPPES